MRRTKEEAEVTREKLLTAALAVFSRQGYGATTLKDIATEAGVTRGAIYWHFGGKAEIYSALVNERFAVANSVFAQILSHKGTPLELLRLMLIRSLEYVEEDEEYRKVLELTWFKTEITPDLAEMIQQKIEGTRAFTRNLEGMIRAGIEAGEIRSDVDPEAAAIAAVGMFGGVLSSWMLDPELFSIKEKAPAVVDAFIGGLEAR